MTEAQRGEGWKEIRGALQRDFRFENFREAIAFVNRLAVVAEEVDHHPEIAIRWNLVRIRWRTHAKRAITQRDVEMAKRTGELATSSHEAPPSALALLAEPVPPRQAP